MPPNRTTEPRRCRFCRIVEPVPALLILTWPLSALASPGWIDSWDTWKNLGSVAAVAISLIALIATQRTTHAKTTREKREELKGSIEKLLDFRAEYEAKYATFATDQERDNFSIRLNTKKLIYLESAEYLARQLRHVTSAEWGVLAYEYQLNSNFTRAEELFRQSLRAARSSSLVTQISALRALAGIQMLRGPAGTERGRRSYGQALRMVEAQRDPYSMSAAAITYRQWSSAEYNLNNMNEARDRLRDALQVVRKMPDRFPLKQLELRQCIDALLMVVADTSENLVDLPAWREALDDAAAMIMPLKDDISEELSGRLTTFSAELQRREGDLEASGHSGAQAWAATGAERQTA